jgi:hypothetical protein
MRNKSVAGLLAIAALSFGAVAPASSLAAKKRAVKADPPPAAIDLSALCSALGLQGLLGGLSIDLSPLVRVKIVKICE